MEEYKENSDYLLNIDFDGKEEKEEDLSLLNGTKKKKKKKNKLSKKIRKQTLKEQRLLSDLPKLFQDTTHKPLTLREKIFLTMDDPKSGNKAFYYNLFSNFIVCCSIVVFLLSSLPDYWENEPPSLLALEYSFFSFYLIEFLIKLFCCPKWYKWIIKPFTILDILVLVPYFIQAMLNTATTAGIGRVFRVFKVIQMLKFGKSSETFYTLFKTLKNSRDGFLLLIFTVGVATIVFSTCLFYAEQIDQTFDPETRTWMRSDGTPSPFQSIPDTFWWCIETITTVGYGDIYPVTWLGKIVASVAMCIGILVIAFPITLFGIHFSEIWRYQLRKVQMLQVVHHLTPEEKFSQRSLVLLLREIEKHHHNLAEDLNNVFDIIQETQLRHQQISQSIVALNEEIKILKTRKV